MWVDEVNFKWYATRVRRVDLSGVTLALTTLPKGPRFPLAGVAAALELYRKFLTIKGLHWDQKVVPSSSIDTVWHAHILITDVYAQDCNALFGHFLHHDPFFGGGNPSEKAAYRAAKKWTSKAITQYFNLSPQEYWAQLL